MRAKTVKNVEKERAVGTQAIPGLENARLFQNAGGFWNSLRYSLFIVNRFGRGLDRSH
jgi:hypothetical protein